MIDKNKGETKKCSVCGKWLHSKSEKYSIRMFGKCINCRNK